MTEGKEDTYFVVIFYPYEGYHIREEETSEWAEYYLFNDKEKDGVIIKGQIFNTKGDGLV